MLHASLACLVFLHQILHDRYESFLSMYVKALVEGHFISPVRSRQLRTNQADLLASGQNQYIASWDLPQAEDRTGRQLAPVGLDSRANQIEKSLDTTYCTYVRRQRDSTALQNRQGHRKHSLSPAPPLNYLAIQIAPLLIHIVYVWSWPA